MRLGTTSQDGPVVDFRFSCYAYIAGKDAVVSDYTIVGDVHIGHNQGVAADPGDELAAGLGAPVDSGALAYGHVVTHLDIGNLPFVFQVLRDGTDHGAREYLAVPAHPYITIDHRVRMDLATVADLYIIVDECEWSDLYVVAQDCIRADMCQW